jgi:hypothetical protein
VRGADVIGHAADRQARPVTAREITDAPIAEKAPTATGKQAIDVQAAILVALRKRDGETVGGEGGPTRWRQTDGE